MLETLLPLAETLLILSKSVFLRIFFVVFSDKTEMPRRGNNKRARRKKRTNNHEQQSFGSTINSGEAYLGQFDATNSTGKNDKNEVIIHR